MPDEPKKSFLRKLFGHNPLSKSYGEEWPELQKQWAGREIEFPDEAAKTNKILPMGSVFKWLKPDAYAVTGPMGTIALNKELIEKDKQNLGDVLSHELAHIGQGKMGFLRSVFNFNEVENEAVNKEAMRKIRRGDIHLRGK